MAVRKLRPLARSHPEARSRRTGIRAPVTPASPVRQTAKNRTEGAAVPMRLPAATKSVPRLRKELSAEAVGGNDVALRTSTVPSLRELIGRIKIAVVGRRYGRKTVRERPRWGRRRRWRAFRSAQGSGGWEPAQGSGGWEPAQACACLLPIRRSCGRGPPLPPRSSTTQASQASRYL